MTTWDNLRDIAFPETSETLNGLQEAVIEALDEGRDPTPELLVAVINLSAELTEARAELKNVDTRRIELETRFTNLLIRLAQSGIRVDEL